MSVSQLAYFLHSSVAVLTMAVAAMVMHSLQNKVAIVLQQCIELEQELQKQVEHQAVGVK